MFYQGKAQSFSSLGRVQSIEDLAKKERPNYRKKVKSCKILYSTPKATISKKTSRGPCASLITRRGTFLGGSRPSFSVHKNFWNSIFLELSFFMHKVMRFFFHLSSPLVFDAVGEFLQ